MGPSSIHIGPLNDELFSRDACAVFTIHSPCELIRIFFQHIVTHIPIARQRLGKRARNK
jgi:hypothetical protein